MATSDLAVQIAQTQQASLSDVTVWLPSAVAIVVVVVGIVGQWAVAGRQIRHERNRYLTEQRRSLYVAYLTAVSDARWACSQAATLVNHPGVDLEVEYSPLKAKLSEAWADLMQVDFDVELIGSTAFSSIARELTAELVRYLAAGIAGDAATASDWLENAHPIVQDARDDLVEVARKELLRGRALY